MVLFFLSKRTVHGLGSSRYNRLFETATREQLIHAYSHQLEAGTEYTSFRRNLARLRLTLVAAAPLPGEPDDPQLQRLEQLGMPRVPSWRPGRVSRVGGRVFIDESQGLSTGAVAIVAAVLLVMIRKVFL